MVTVKSLATALGRRQIATAVGVLPTAVSNAVVKGLFPSSWFPVIRSMAESAGLDCPLNLFGWKDVPPNVEQSSPRQGQVSEKSSAA